VVTEQPIADALVSPSGRYLALASRSGAELWDLVEKRRLFALPSPEGPLAVILSFTEDESRLITAAKEILWTAIPEGTQVRSVPLSRHDGICAIHPSGSALACDFLPETRHVVIGVS
jgi:hypothetical protein